MVIAIQVFGWPAINYAQGYLTASSVAPTMLDQPVATALLAAPRPGEMLSHRQILCGVIVWASVYCVDGPSQPRGKPWESATDVIGECDQDRRQNHTIS